MSTDGNMPRGNERLAAILQSGAQPRRSGENSYDIQRTDPRDATGGPGEASIPGNQNQVIPTSYDPRNQPFQPSGSEERNRQNRDDSENIDPGSSGSDILEDILNQSGQQTGANRAEEYARLAGEAAGRMTMLAGTATALNTAFNGLTNRTLRVNEVLGEYNGQIAGALAEAKGRTISRMQRTGEEIGPEYARLARSKQDMRDMMAEIQAPLQSAGLEIAASVQETKNWVFSWFQPKMVSIAETLDWLTDFLPGASDAEKEEPVSTQTAGRKFLSDLSDGKFDGYGTSYMNPGNRPLMTDQDRVRIFGP